MSHKKIINLFLLIMISLFFSTTLFAKKKAEKLVKVGCVDINAVFENTYEKKEIEAKLDSKRKELEAKKENIENELQSLITEFSNKKKKLKPNEITEYNIKIFNKKKELADFIDSSNKQLSEMEDELLRPLLKKIQSVIKEVSIRLGFSMIIDKSTYVIYVEKFLDITDEVIDELKKQYKEEKRNEERE